VTPGVLYRAGQLSQAGLERVIQDYGIRTIITLRDANVPGMVPPDQAEETYCRSRGLNYVRITPRPWSVPTDAEEPPGMIGVRQFLATLDDASQHPVLIHCFAGMHRTGVHCAIYRMEYDRWSPTDAIGEMRHCGYTNIDHEDDVRGFLQSYRPRWQRQSAAQK
jgi:protein tyrosine/serine phosphatase